MIKAIAKELLDDDYIIKEYVENLNINDRLLFNKNNIYYFGNYKEDELNKIEQKLIRNRKSLIKAIDKGVRFIICGNSINIFNNSFKANKLNIFTAYNIKLKRKRIYTNKSNDIKLVYNLNTPIDSINFKYKNLICISNLKRQSISTLSY